MSGRHAQAPQLTTAARMALGGGTRGAAFFCYHSINDDGPEFLSIPPATFERQLAALRAAGYASGDETALRRVLRGEALDRPHAFLTFDDAYRDNYTTAWPLLRRHGLRGLVFVVTDLVGDRLLWPEVTQHVDRFPDTMRAMDWPMIEEMAASGMEFGSHTKSHPRLTELCDEELAQELLDSRLALKSRLGRCDVLAYPFGSWDRRVLDAAAAAGYASAMALSPVPDLLRTPLSVPRIPIDRRDDGWRFRLKLTRPVRRFLTSPASAGPRSAVRRARGLLHR